MNIEKVAIIGVVIIAMVMGFVIGSTEAEENSACAYCQNTISEHADMVICTDGRRYHAECYLRYIEEGENGKANSEAP